MADDSARLLGFAFASADLLFEIEPDGTVGLALGASRQLTGIELSTMQGVPWRAFVAEEDAPVVAAFFAGLNAGDRRGPIRVGLKPTKGRRLKRYGALSAYCLPQLAPRISCAFSTNAPGSAAADPTGPHGLYTAEGLNAVAEIAMRQSARTGVELNMELVELAGLSKAAAALGSTRGAKALMQVAAALRAESLDGSAAAEIEKDRFAFLRSRAEPLERVTERLTRAIADLGLSQITPTINSLAMTPETPADGLLALKVALDRFMATPPAEGESLGGMVRQTVTEANQFRSAIAARRFSLVYQPVVNLKTGATDHYEVLVRFGDDASPAAAIQMAESMEIIHDLDFAIVQAVVAELQKGHATTRLAANISARSLMQPTFTSKLIQTVKANPSVRGRLIIEITENAAIDDLAAADTIVRRLRAENLRVALDDFGAGAASFDYLRAIGVDEVKIDGRYIREMASGADRSAVLVRHLTELCRELKISTVAELVETGETADMLRQFGVDFGQGYLFGRPAAQPTPAPLRRAAPAPVAARRVGAVESWG